MVMCSWSLKPLCDDSWCNITDIISEFEVDVVGKKQKMD